MYTRREFGKITLAGLPLSLALGANSSRFDGVRIGVQSYSFRTLPLEAAIKAMSDIGITECEFSEHEVEMPAGSRMFLYSDGVTEAVNSALEEYGPDRILKHVTSPTATVQTLLHDVDQFTAGYAESDDITVVTIAATA